jgi:hypothetical protein
MAFGDPPVTVTELLTSAKKVADSIARHREAMAQVAAQVRQQQPSTPNEGVNKQ